jgi:hypothetical protein
MFAITVEPKTFNNHLGFERGLWKHQITTFTSVPKRTVFAQYHPKHRFCFQDASIKIGSLDLISQERRSKSVR